MIYLYRALYITGVFTLLKVMSLFIEIPVAELAGYTSLVILADILCLNRLKRILTEQKKETTDE